MNAIGKSVDLVELSCPSLLPQATVVKDRSKPRGGGILRATSWGGAKAGDPRTRDKDRDSRDRDRDRDKSRDGARDKEKDKEREREERREERERERERCVISVVFRCPASFFVVLTAPLSLLRADQTASLTLRHTLRVCDISFHVRACTGRREQPRGKGRRKKSASGTRGTGPSEAAGTRRESGAQRRRAAVPLRPSLLHRERLRAHAGVCSQGWLRNAAQLLLRSSHRLNGSPTGGAGGGGRRGSWRVVRNEEEEQTEHRS